MTPSHIQQSTLDAIISSGDPLFAFELRVGTALLGYVPTKASLIRARLDTRSQSSRAATLRGTVSSSVVYFGPLSGLAKSDGIFTTAVKWLRWWRWPLLFMVGCWALLVRTEDVLDAVPASFLFWGAANSSASLVDALPPHPTSMAEAFKLGGLLQQLFCIQNATATGAGAGTQASAVAAVLVEAAAVAGRPAGSTLTAAELSGVYTEILQIESQVGVVTRVKGFFTFVNTIWFVAILGIAVSIGPSLYHVLKPLRAWIKRVLERLYYDLVLPVVTRLHRWGMFEFVAFLACWLQTASGYKMMLHSAGGRNSNADSAEMVALTGSILVVPVRV